MSGTVVEVLPNSPSIEVVERNSVVEVVKNTPTVTTNITKNLIETNPRSLEVITVGIQGVQGIKGDDGSGGGAEPPYRQYDSQPANNLYYKGWSDDADTSTPTWKILKGVETSPDVFLELWAEGNEDLDNIWDDRASLIYS